MAGVDKPSWLLRQISEFIGTYAPSFLTESEHTLRSYRMAISSYLAFLEDERGVTKSTISKADFERASIELWLNKIREDGAKPQTCNVRLAGLRSLVKYIASRDPSLAYLTVEAAGIPAMKTPKTKVSGLSKAAVKAILACPDQSTPTGRRDSAMIVFAYGTAARVSEILNLRVGQLILCDAKPRATIVGKGGKARTLYLLPRVVSYLKRHLSEFHPGQRDPDDLVF